MLGTSKKGKNPMFEDLKIFENLEICSLKSHFMLGANKVNDWGTGKKKLGYLRICEICLLKISASGLIILGNFPS